MWYRRYFATPFSPINIQSVSFYQVIIQWGNILRCSLEMLGGESRDLVIYFLTCSGGQSQEQKIEHVG